MRDSAAYLQVIAVLGGIALTAFGVLALVANNALGWALLALGLFGGLALWVISSTVVGVADLRDDSRRSADALELLVQYEVSVDLQAVTKQPSPPLKKLTGADIAELRRRTGAP